MRRLTRANGSRRLLQLNTGALWSRDQLLLGLLSSAGGLLFLIALDQAAGGFDRIFWLLAPLPALLVSRNDSGFPLAYWGLMLFGWVYLTPVASFSPWAILAAAGLILGHASAALSASAPSTAGFPGRVVRRWAGRLLIALAAAAGVAVAVGALSGEVDSLGPVAQAVGLLGVALGVWFLRSDAPARPE
jgi:hypothetical protein